MIAKRQMEYGPVAIRRLSFLLTGSTAFALATCPPASFASRGPMPAPAPAPLPVPIDHPFQGTITLNVDATDTSHKIFRVHERVPLNTPGPLTLFYPQWETASHAPTGPIWALAGLLASVNGRPVEWHRDPVNPYAFRFDVPSPTNAIDLSFQYISPPTGAVEMTPDLLALTWSRTLLYPAGWFARDIAVRASVTLPPGFRSATSLETVTRIGNTIDFAPVDLEVLADSPLYAGRHSLHLDLTAGAAQPVAMDLFADSDRDLVLDAGRLDHLRAGIRAARRVFGLGHYERYDMLVSLSDRLPSDGGLEHQRSSEIQLPANFFRDPNRTRSDETLFTHEYVHSWNGVSRQGVGMWTPDFNTPKRDDSLWIYEGQTELWGVVLAARARLLTGQEALDLLAVYAATQQARVGRIWKSLADTTNDPVYMIGHSIPDRDWQRREDFYGGGLLLWLDVAMTLRRQSDDRIGLDDFAHDFFGGDDPGTAIRTYPVAAVQRTLNELSRFDWASLLDAHLDAHDDRALLRGLTKGGYRLVFDRTQSVVFQQEAFGDTDLSYSLGLTVRPDGRLDAVAWDGPAFRAGLSPGATIMTVNHHPFTAAALLAATDASTAEPVLLGVRTGDGIGDVVVPYHGPLRFPHLAPIPGAPDRLGRLLRPDDPDR